MKNRALVRSMALGAALGVGLPSGDALAEGAMDALPISACRQAGSGGTRDFRWEGLYNSSTTSELTLECSVPLAHKVGVSETLRWAEIDVRDNSSARSVTCAMKVINATYVIYTGASQSTGAAFTGMGLLSWTSIGDVHGNAYFSCSIPRKAEGESGITYLYGTGFT
jgi:hypothetical protein